MVWWRCSYGDVVGDWMVVAVVVAVVVMAWQSCLWQCMRHGGSSACAWVNDKFPAIV